MLPGSTLNARLRIILRTVLVYTYVLPGGCFIHTFPVGRVQQYLHQQQQQQSKRRDVYYCYVAHSNGTSITRTVRVCYSYAGLQSLCI